MKGLEDFIPHTLMTHGKTNFRTEFETKKQREKRSASRAPIPQAQQSRRPGTRRGVHATETVEIQENRSEQTYRPLGDRLGLTEPARKAHKR